MSFLALLLLCLVGYSGGATSNTRKLPNLKPQLPDIILVMFIWAGAIYSRISFDINKFLLILSWFFLSFIIGSFMTWSKKLSKKKSLSKDVHQVATKNPLKNFWTNFSKRMGSFQSRILLSLFFFIVVTPLAILVKAFSDPLKIKKRKKSSYWIFKKEITLDLDQYKRQF